MILRVAAVENNPATGVYLTSEGVKGGALLEILLRSWDRPQAAEFRDIIRWS
jgi:hypothetical protein